MAAEAPLQQGSYAYDPSDLTIAGLFKEIITQQCVLSRESTSYVMPHKAELSFLRSPPTPQHAPPALGVAQESLSVWQIGL